MNLEKYLVDSSEIKEILFKYNEEFLSSGILEYYVSSNFNIHDFIQSSSSFSEYDCKEFTKVS